jgi:hypothetical protein
MITDYSALLAAGDHRLISVVMQTLGMYLTPAPSAVPERGSQNVYKSPYLHSERGR